MLRYKLLPALLLCIAGSLRAQELFVFTEPASNMPAKTVGIRVSNWMMQEDNAARTDYHLIPEIMWGVNKRLMLHAEGYFSNTSGTLSAEGAGIYAKYRFLSKDKVYRHFRMAAFARYAVNNATIHQEEIAVNGRNTGYQLGIIATQLLHKTALSFTGYYEQAMNNLQNNEIPASQADQAVNYTLSAGHLLLPKKYKNYKQTNLNIMAELLGQILPQNGKYFLDIAPSLQLIVNSQTRIDIGYKQQLYNNMLRTAPNGLVIRVEHLLYDVF